MANLKASKQEIKVNERNRQRNKDLMTRLRSLIKKTAVSIEKKSTESPDLVKKLVKIIDQTQSKGVIHKNTANRKKAKYMKLLSVVINDLKEPAKEEVKPKKKKVTTKKKESTKAVTKTATKDNKKEESKKEEEPKKEEPKTAKKETAKKTDAKDTAEEKKDDKKDEK